ncbi:MAG: NAD-glutamate dehydrogenase domain-containing protein [Thermomonas sp.]
MNTKLQTASDAISKPIMAALAKRLPKSRIVEAQAFAIAFYRRMDPDEYAQHGAESWAALVADLLEFSRVRKPGKSLVRLFNANVKQHGWESLHTIVQIVNDDMPFLVDSVSMALADMGIGVHVLGHPVIALQRDKAGKLTGVGQGKPESFIHLEIDRQSQDAMAMIKSRIECVLAEVRSTVNDWEPMHNKMLEIADEMTERPSPVSAQGRVEAQEFLRWAADDHFTYLGYREYKVTAGFGKGAAKDALLVADEDSGLGLLRGKDAREPRKLKSLAAHFMPQSGAIDALILTKTNSRSSVHRPGYMDYIGVVSFDAKGKAVAEQRFIGLYTSSAYLRRPWDIPLVRERHHYVMERSGLDSTSHSGKALRHILETLPRDELFQSSEEELLRTSMGILGLQERVRSKLFLRRDRFGRYFSALVYIPRERMSTQIRHRIEDMLKDALNGEHVDSNVQIGDSPLAQIHMIVRPKNNDAIEVDMAALEENLAAIVRDWRDELREQLISRHGEEAGLKLAELYGRALPAGYIEEVSPQVAATDVDCLAALTGPDDLRLSLYRSHRQGESLRFKLFRQLNDIPLSDALPMMENMGLRVISEHPYKVETSNGVSFIQDFEVESMQGELDVASLDENFEAAFARIWHGDAENDGFNRLVLAAGLSWKQVAMLRSYCKYLLQVGVPFSQAYVEATLTRYPLLSRLLVELFEARFDPSTGKESKTEISRGMGDFETELKRLAHNDDATMAALKQVIDARTGSRERQIEATRATLLGLMDRVSSLDEDRILRSFIGVMEATLRTSYYIPREGGLRKDGGPADYVSYKLDCARVPDLPKPRPYREIWVCGPRVEGIHLRYGPVARGGLRWSDRREDFRTEVLGLVKAQMVKNTVIVPVGSKGGFFCKQLPDPAVNRDAWFNEGVACYKRFINGLLDITDNLVNGKVAPPVGVVRHDEDDPYLVVAADKGTATFSDTANAIAQAHGYWLDDAFASGGSVGYDHKGMGITARGAWESVKRHFREMGIDTQATDFTVAGIGDMSGDVFGNGMLLSKHIRLIAAFDHRHIFLDPGPDPAKSFAERERLFRLPRSSWADYDATLISQGGGIHPRSAKSIAITPEVAQALDMQASALTPAELVNAILKSPADLLYNGGIGTYVKAKTESHAQVGDRANDAVRVDGAELRCKVVAEGGNLGCTQLGRIEYAQSRGRIYTDAIDNSAGVDTSDHEVNIKILLGLAIAEGELTEKQRNALLAEMTDDVAALVLRDNYFQTQALSVTGRIAVSLLDAQHRFIQFLEKNGRLNRAIEFLPTDEAIAERHALGEGLTAPERAVLLAYSKIWMYDELLASRLPDDPWVATALSRYFPRALRERYSVYMTRHPLKREIIATHVTNSTINRIGSTLVHRLMETTGAKADEIVRAYLLTREIFGFVPMWQSIEALDNAVDDAVQSALLIDSSNLLERGTTWFLRSRRLTDDMAATIELFTPRAEALATQLPDLLDPADKARVDEAVAAYVAQGVPQEVAARVVALPTLYSTLDIVEAADAAHRPVELVAQIYFDLSTRLGVPWLRDKLAALPADQHWKRLAKAAMQDDLSALQRSIASEVLMGGADMDKAQPLIAAWRDRNSRAIERQAQLLTELRAAPAVDAAMLSVALREMRSLG